MTIKSALLAVADWVGKRWPWNRRAHLRLVEPTIVEPITGVDSPPIVSKQPRRESIRSFKADVLDRLDHYFVYLARMKKYAHDNFALHSQTGAWLGIYDTESEDDFEKALRAPLSPWWKENRPGFGCVLFSADAVADEIEEKRNVWSPKFVAFTKMTKPSSDIQKLQCAGDVYMVHVLWDDWWKKIKSGKDVHKGAEQEFAIHLSADNTVTVLKMKTACQVPLPRKRGEAQNSFVRTEWGIPRDYKEWARQHGVDARTYLAGVFTYVASLYENQHLHAMIEIRAKKRGLTALFTIDTLDTPRFFRDREQVVVNGKTKRIFHAVRAHARLGKSVKLHFRGLRQFVWNGYEIAISIPYREFRPAIMFEGGMHHDSEYDDNISDKPKHITPGELGRIMEETRLKQIGRTVH